MMGKVLNDMLRNFYFYYYFLALDGREALKILIKWCDWG